MKNSNIQWIGDIPDDWEVVKIKYLPNNEVNSFTDGDWIDSQYISEQGIRYYTTGNIGDGFFKEQGSGYISEETFKLLNCKYAYPNDLVFSRLNEPYCRSCILPKNEEKYVLAVDNVILRTNENKKYICYVSQCEGFHKSASDVAFGSTMKRVSRTKLGNLYIPLPPLATQTSIATYLDAKCSQIDGLIADINKQIETLNELKKSTITEAVTKGLNKNAKLKDSGIQWIGMIPEGWSVIRIGRLFSLRNERNYLPMNEVQLLSLYTGIGVFPHGEQEERGNKAVSVEGYKIVHKNDIVVNIILAWMGAIGISNYDGVTSPAYDVYIPNLDLVIPHFFHYVFRTQGIAEECYRYGRGIMKMRWRTYSQEFKQISVPYPPLAEQRAIATYLDTKCTEFDSIISDKQKQISTLEAYKKSLIYEYVTGKNIPPVIDN